jgi:uncharacterized protein DUF6644
VLTFLARVQASGLATTIGQSQMLTSVLSSVHLIGLTLLVGGMLVSSLRLMGVVLKSRPASEVTSAPRRAVVVGLCVSVASGLLLLAPRVTNAVQNGFFQLKMILLIVAALFSFTVLRQIAQGREGSPFQMRVEGVFGLLLWFGVVLSGAAFILLE